MGVRDIGAFRGRSLLFLGVGAVTCCAPRVGLLFCASLSRSLTALSLSFLSHGADGGHSCCFPPLVMLVSGTPSLRGGGGRFEARVVDRTVSVMRGRFEDCRTGRKDENGHLCAFKQCAHLRVDAGWEAKRKMVDIEGVVVRREAMPEES